MQYIYAEKTVIIYLIVLFMKKLKQSICIFILIYEKIQNPLWETWI